jgi:tRNA (guanine-N7-)-methyltransferase
MTESESESESDPQGSRLHGDGRLSFRHRVRKPIADSIPYVDGTQSPTAWRTMVPADSARVEIEIGCGKGTFLKTAALRRPEVFFLGIEASPEYARYCADRIQRAGCSNARMLADNARAFLRDAMPDAAVDTFHIYYPDPWPKRRHRKRRLFQPGMERELARGLKDSGLLLVATDSTAYFGEILTVLGQGAELRRDWELEATLGEGVEGECFVPTNFQIKYRQEGRTLHRAAFRRLPRALAGHAATAHPARVTWIPVAPLADLPDQSGRSFDVGGRDLALFRVGDQVFALENSCPHRGAALAEGVVSEGQVACTWHGWRFELATGKCNTIPDEQARTYRVRVMDGMVEVEVPGA